MLYSYKKRLLGLDIIRVIAISLVFYQHGMFLLYAHINNTVANIQFALSGFWGVELFFVLSGFLVGGIFIKEFNAPSGFKLQDLFRFWKRRWLRTLPNYYFVLLCLLFFGVPFYELSHYFIFMQNFAWQSNMAFAQAWSLSIEEWFYILFPLVSCLVCWLIIQLKYKVSRNRILLAVIMGYILVGNLMRVAYLLSDYKLIFRLEQSTIFRLDSIVYGVLLAWLHVHYKTQLMKFKNKLLSTSVIILCIMLVVHVKFLLIEDPLPWALLLKLSITPLIFTLLLPYFIYKEFRFPEIFKRGITLVSKVSYSMYLNHYFILIPISAYIKTSNLIEGVLVFLGAYLFSVLLSALQFRVIEEPFLRSRKPS